jgi:photosystem I subunit 3
MRRLFAILLSAFLFLGLAPLVNAAGEDLNADRDSTSFSASALTTCSENSRFNERASQASSPKDIARFERYSKASCGDDGLPHLIIAPTIEPFGALANRHHEGDVLIPAHIFIYIAGIIGWSGREYLNAIKGKKNAAENEIYIDFALARACLIKGAAWPLEADKQGKSGALRESDDKITLNGPR